MKCGKLWLMCILTVFLGCNLYAQDVYKYNFGSADISSEAGYEDWAYGEVDYSSTSGYGWTYVVNGVGGLNQYDRGATPPERYKATQNLDLTDNSSMPDPYTFRVDLPNGTYDVTFGIGFSSQASKSCIMVGDTFLTAPQDDIVDEASCITTNTETSAGEYKTYTLTFNVTKGYLLCGSRRHPSTTSSRYGSIWGIIIRKKIVNPNNMQFNFGATDISIEAGYENWTYGEIAYDSNVGYGWLLAPVALYDRGTPAEREKATVDLDIRSATEPPFTFRVDIPNGKYQITFGTGFEAPRQVRSVFLAGDEFALDGTLSEENAVSLDTETVAAGTYPTFTLNYEVTNGYMLLGWKNSTESSLWGSLWGISIKPLRPLVQGEIAKMNFGAKDISEEAGYEDTYYAEVAYEPELGYGWTYVDNSTLMKYDRSAPADDRFKATADLDIRSNSVPLDPFTFRVDLDNGYYDIEYGLGFDSQVLRSIVSVGDTFLTGTSEPDTIIDESVAEVLPTYAVLTNSYKTVPFRFKVTKGYLLIGTRRAPLPSSVYGGLYGITITPSQQTCEDVWDEGAGIIGDINHDCTVDLEDFSLLVYDWQECNNPGDAACQNWNIEDVE